MEVVDRRFSSEYSLHIHGDGGDSRPTFQNEYRLHHLGDDKGGILL
jgi:hypothetical protein